MRKRKARYRVIRNTVCWLSHSPEPVSIRRSWQLSFLLRDCNYETTNLKRIKDANGFRKYTFELWDDQGYIATYLVYPEDWDENTIRLTNKAKPKPHRMTLSESRQRTAMHTGLERRPCAIHPPYPHDPVPGSYGQDTARIDSGLGLTKQDSVLIY